ncbi:MAG: pirin family protein, partial [Proteobacteria bacterium]
INWMIAGRGIVHSERTPPETRASGYRLHAIQCWVAYPEKFEEIEPQFYHHPKATLPEFKAGDVQLKLLLGTLLGQKSPVQVHTDIFYAETKMPKGSTLSVPLGNREGAVHVVKGSIVANGDVVEAMEMGIAKNGDNLELRATDDSVVMLLGGEAIGKRFIFWNLVSSTEVRIEEAKLDWARGPGAEGSRFPLIPGDSSEFIPLPEEPKKNPKGTSF